MCARRPALGGSGRQRAAARGRRPRHQGEHPRPARLPAAARDRRRLGLHVRPEPNCDDRRIALPRGKVLGGSSSVNAMVYIRGNHRDYDDWGAEGWAWDDLFPYFLKAEDNERGASEWHASGGPLPVSDQRSGQPAPEGVRRGRGRSGAGAQRGLQRRRTGRRRPLPGDPARRDEGERRGRLPAPGDGPAPEPHGYALHAGRPGAVRRHSRGRRRGRPGSARPRSCAPSAR